MSACISRRFLAENQAFSELCGQGLPTNSAEEAVLGGTGDNREPTSIIPLAREVCCSIAGQHQSAKEIRVGGHTSPMPEARTRLRRKLTVGRLTPRRAAIVRFCSPANAMRITRHRSATCCGVPWADSHCSSCARSLGLILIAKLDLRTRRASSGSPPYVKLFERHYTSSGAKLEEN